MSTGSRITGPEEEANPARISVVGVGGGGGNVLSRMIDCGLQGVRFIAINTDLQALWSNRAGIKIQIGEKITNGLGAGANPEIGRQAAMEDTEKISYALKGSDMVFITTGLGGGTGTGGAPVVASIARQLGSDVLTVAVVTLPFTLEGKRRMAQASEGLAALKECVDSVIAIPNDRLLESVPRHAPVYEAFSLADDVLLHAVQGITDIITVPGQINVDFADVRAVMQGMGQAVIGIGMADGPLRALQAAQRAISNPLLEDSCIQGARGIIVNVTGGPDLSLAEASESTSFITRAAHAEANVIYGIVTNDSMHKAVKVTVIATGFEPSARASGKYQADGKARGLRAADGGGFFGKRLGPKAANAHGLDLSVSALVRRLRGGSKPR
jgi:cell division protein FtsZ